MIRKKKKKDLVILQILPRLNAGGVEHATLESAKAISNRGHQSLLISGGGTLESSLSETDTIHFKLPVYKKNPLSIYLNIEKIFKIIKEYKVDIIHARSRAPAWSAFYAAKKAGCKFVTTFHGAYSFSNNIKKRYNEIMTKGEKIIAVSQFIKDHIQENYNIEDSKIDIIHDATNVEKFNIANINKQRIINLSQKYNIETDRPIILVPGRITKIKGHELIIKSLANLQDKNFTCLFVGPYLTHISYKKSLDKLIESYGLQNIVRFTGEVTDMPALYSLADIIISASTKPEAFGRTITEAQAMGRLVIASNHGGAKEIIENEKTGWLFENGNQQELAKIIEKAINLNKRSRKIITNRAQKSVKEKFSLTLIEKKIINFYESL